MIYVRIELWPGGNDTRARVLQEVVIHNTGGDASVGEYECIFSKVGGFKDSVENVRRAVVKNILRVVEVKGFPRRRLYAHDILFRALREAFGARNPLPKAEP